MKKLLFIIMFLSLSSHAIDLHKIYDIIKHVETNNREYAVGDNGKAFGVVQIHKICVDGINRLYKTKYTHRQAFDESCSREMFILYLSAGIKRFKVRHCRSPTEEEIVRMWNGGIYTGYKRDSTIDYYKRYKKYKKLLSN